MDKCHDLAPRMLIDAMILFRKFRDNLLFKTTNQLNYGTASHLVGWEKKVPEGESDLWVKCYKWDTLDEDYGLTIGFSNMEVLVNRINHAKSWWTSGISQLSVKGQKRNTLDFMGHTSYTISPILLSLFCNPFKTKNHSELAACAELQPTGQLTSPRWR